MTPVVKKASPAAIAILKQATAAWPRRSRLSDGLLPSPAHQQQNPNSDHNSGLAADLTHDPANGVNAPEIMEKLKADPRVKYLIHNGHIWVAREAKKGNQPYIGANPHKHHLHVSINPESANDVRPWYPWAKPTMVGQIKAIVQPKPVKKP